MKMHRDQRFDSGFYISFLVMVWQETKLACTVFYCSSYHFQLMGLVKTRVSHISSITNNMICLCILSLWVTPLLHALAIYFMRFALVSRVFSCKKLHFNFKRTDKNWNSLYAQFEKHHIKVLSCPHIIIFAREKTGKEKIVFRLEEKRSLEQL